jgi:predicted AAA+ superfamily ATPase
MITRALKLPAPGSETFFLWGPRQSGKSTLLRATYPDAVWVDLLKSDEYRRYLQRPETLRQELEALGGVPFVVIDEVQKVPALLDEVHWLHENRGVRFSLCGSSARKVRRGHANLLGGRAVRYELSGLVSRELGDDFDLDRLLNHGYLPRMYLSQGPERLLRAYVGDYLKEEVAAEGLVRKLPVFSEFLNVASLSDAELVSFSTIARECGVSSQTIRDYFGVLEDTLVGSWLPAWRARPKRRVVSSPKFYFSDVGVVNSLARRGRIERGSALFGKAFENWVHHELRSRDAYSGRLEGLSHWRLPSGIEVDFILGQMRVAVEAKASAVVTSDHLKGLRHLVADHPEVARRVIVCLEARARRTPDGIDVMPAAEFCRRLWAGELD